MADLFDGLDMPQSGTEILAESALLLRGWALDQADDILAAIADIARLASFRNMVTPSGHIMSVAMTSCGALGWVSDARGYRYAATDPGSGKPWPAMPDLLQTLATRAATEAGFRDFRPDSCLINRYLPGTALSLHQDRNERDLDRPVVSVSLGLPAIFQFGGAKRSDPVRRHPLHHGDVVVWGGPSRLFFHGILKLKDGEHPKTGRMRLNLTFRCAG